MRELVLACSKLLVAAKTKLTKREQRVKQTARGLATTGLYYHAELSCQIKTNGNTTVKQDSSTCISRQQQS